MTIEDFLLSIKESKPPQDISLNLQALWYDARGEWERAHEIVQETGGLEGDWIHAYLHRKEGDLGNASYWYSRIGKTHPSKDLDEEWKDLANYLLNK